MFGAIIILYIYLMLALERTLGSLFPKFTSLCPCVHYHFGSLNALYQKVRGILVRRINSFPPTKQESSRMKIRGLKAGCVPEIKLRSCHRRRRVFTKYHQWRSHEGRVDTCPQIKLQKRKKKSRTKEWTREKGEMQTWKRERGTPY